MFTYRDIPNHFSFADVYDAAAAGSPDPATFVEVGTWLGASAAYMAGKIRESGKNIKFYAVDNFTGEGSGPKLRVEAGKLGGNFYPKFCENLRKCLVSEFVHPIRGDSTATAMSFEDRSIDFVYIDASHNFAKVKLDVLAWLPKIKDGGVIAGHDYSKSHRGVVRAVNSIFGRNNVKVMTHSWVFSRDRLNGWWPVN